MAIEYKVDEPFGLLVSEWLVNASPRYGRLTPLETLSRILKIDPLRAEGLRYQLIHRTASAIYEAHPYRAKAAAMMVHSFDARGAGTATGPKPPIS